MFALTSKSQERREIRAEEDVVGVRSSVKRVAVLLGFSLVNQTKIVTCASELARNALEHRHGGTMILEIVGKDVQKGIRMTFEDRGPGIPDVKLAMEDGFTTAKGMGLGLGGSKRLMDEFEIESTPGAGTVVKVTKWVN